VSALLRETPVLRIAIRNPFLELDFPSRGTVMGVIDTGYDGFVAVPEGVFSALGLDKISPFRRTVLTADGRPLELTVSLASVDVPDLGRSFAGPAETAAGVDEILVGTRLLRDLKLTLDYCARIVKVEGCR